MLNIHPPQKLHTWCRTILYQDGGTYVHGEKIPLMTSTLACMNFGVVVQFVDVVVVVPVVVVVG